MLKFRICNFELTRIPAAYAIGGGYHRYMISEFGKTIASFIGHEGDESTISFHNNPIVRKMEQILRDAGRIRWDAMAGNWYTDFHK